jgi:2,4-dienoyl-CoA reductase (NADPH2)
MQPYPHLLSPLDCGALVLRNRVVMGSMHTRLEHADRSTERLSAYYAERARGGVGLILTGGHSPNQAGLVEVGGPIFNTQAHVAEHRPIVEAVHAGGAKICLQILHSGRYGKHDDLVAPSAVRSPINRHTPRALTAAEVEQTIEDYVACAEMAHAAGYDGVEVMGSEGYIITQFTAPRCNRRDDEWGGAFENRIRFPIEIVRRMRARLGPKFLIIYRISALDLVEDGLSGEETIRLSRAVEAAGCDIFNTGIGWHEARVPTIAYMVPRGGWAFAIKRIKAAVRCPVIASNRINTPEVAERLIADGVGDLVSLSRQMLADPDFVNKAAQGRADEINTCIACNQACLDFIFSGRIATCLVNPRACREIELIERPTSNPQSIAVLGAGPAGLAFATTAAKFGHKVTLFEVSRRLGGQMNLAAAVPGKQEFHETIRYFTRHLELYGVAVRLGQKPTAESLTGFAQVVIATGVRPRVPEVPGIDHPKVVSYIDILERRVEAGRRVAILGAGGIGFDIAEFLSAGPRSETSDEAHFFEEWGVDPAITLPGGLLKGGPKPPRSGREIAIFQRKTSRLGANLGVSTGWILRAGLAARGLQTFAGVAYERIDNAGLHYVLNGEVKCFAADTIVICAGQLPERAVHDQLLARGVASHLIGGADVAAELDARRAIEQATRLAMAF